MNHSRIVINSLPQAYQVIKEMNLDRDDADYRSAGRESLEAILEGRMQERLLERRPTAFLGPSNLQH